VHVNDVFDIIAGILTIALVAVVLTKRNTAKDIHAGGSAFTGALKQAEAG
jgi:uncharacterized membrane protein YoaK (UPF0700 family)